MIRRLLLFGATGDLAGRFLLPAIAALHAAAKLPDGFEVVGAARPNWNDEEFRRAAAERLDEHASAAAGEVVRRSLRYRPVDLADPASVATVLGAESEPLAAYLALPPGLFAPAVGALGEVGLPADSRIVVEKPFGEDLESATALNRLLAEVAGDAGEQAVFRVDHVLGMPTVQNLLALRLANRILEPVWNSAYIEQVDIRWEETLALEGRAGFYDRAGALKDVVQNHMLQLLCLVTMEPPTGQGERELRDRKVEALRSVRPLTPVEVESRTRRARYTAGRLAATGGADGRQVPDYAKEDGVDPRRGTETFAELVLELENERWAGTRFLLRAGKALARRRKGIVVRFRRAAGAFVDGDLTGGVAELWIGVDGPTDLALRLTGAAGGSPPGIAPLTLRGEPPRSDLPAYAHVILDVLRGGSTLSIRGDEAEAAWRVVTPVMEAWADGRVPLEEYAAGSTGPRRKEASGRR